MKSSSDWLAIGQLAQRTGLSVSAIRFYEAKGLVTASRNNAGHRRFRRSDIRRVSFVLVAQRLGLSLEEIRAALAKLPKARTPTPTDWARISRGIKRELEARIADLERTRDRLDGCIGCGCLSLKNCALYNPQDELAAQGSGPRLLWS